MLCSIGIVIKNIQFTENPLIAQSSIGTGADYVEILYKLLIFKYLFLQFIY